jgi:hypothetical protein
MNNNFNGYYIVPPQIPQYHTIMNGVQNGGGQTEFPGNEFDGPTNEEEDVHWSSSQQPWMDDWTDNMALHAALPNTYHRYGSVNLINNTLPSVTSLLIHQYCD